MIPLKPLFSILVLMLLSIYGHTASKEPVILRYLNTNMASSITQGWLTTANNASIEGKPMRVAGKHYQWGLGTHAPGKMIFPLNGKRHTFTAEVGVDDEGPDSGSVIFKVLLDGKLAFDSGIMRHGQSAKSINLDITSIKELQLEVTDAGDGVRGDHADWANAAIDDVIELKGVPHFSTAGFFALPTSPRKVLNFNPGWRFYKGDVAGAEKPVFNDFAWDSVNLPHGLEILEENASGGRNYQGPAWYRKRFSIPATMRGHKLIIYFEAVMGKCAVWVNGKKAAEHFGGYLPFAIDITKLVTATGKDNTIAVSADNSDDPNYPPGKPQGDLDFTYLGGIYRNVYLIETAPVHVTLQELSKTVAGGGVMVATTDVNGNNAELEVRTEVANESAVPRKLTVRTILETLDGKELLRKDEAVDLQAGATRQLAQKLSAVNVHLWHPDDPALHYIRTEVLDGTTVLDSLRTRFGIRLFEMRVQDGFFINKKYIGYKLGGVNRHQDYVYIGNALPNATQYRDAKLLREGGNRIVRAAHYPQSPAFLDACDELGMLVTTANPGWQFYNDKNPVFKQLLFEDTHALVRRDRNRPAMLLWETAINETDNTPIEVLIEMHRITHEEIPFPGVFNVTDASLAKPAGFDFYYYGGNNAAVNSFTREYGDGGRVENFYSQNASTRVHASWGEHAAMEQLRLRFDDLNDCLGGPPIYIGGALWCGIDHHRGYHPDPFMGGLLDTFRMPRYSYQLYKSQYDADYKLPDIQTGPMVYITNELTQVSESDVIVLTNCEEVRLTWLGKVIGVEKPSTKYQNLPHPPIIFKNVFDYQVIARDYRDKSGSLSMIAEGLIGGKVVCTETKRYPERTTGIKLTLDDAGIGLCADGSDFVPVRATVVDNKGVKKVLGTEDIHFVVEGAGEIIGGEYNNANPMRTQFGTATALIRATIGNGLIKVRAFAKGLLADELIIRSGPAALPLFYDKAYASASRKSVQPTAQAGPVVPTIKGETDIQKLQAENRRLQLELISKEQDVMDLRGKLKK